MAFTMNVSQTGAFIRTNNVLAPGKTIKVEFNIEKVGADVEAVGVSEPRHVLAGRMTIDVQPKMSIRGPDLHEAVALPVTADRVGQIALRQLPGRGTSIGYLDLVLVDRSRHLTAPLAPLSVLGIGEYGDDPAVLGMNA